MWPVEILLESSHLDSVLILCHMVRACTGCYGDVHTFLMLISKPKKNISFKT